MSTWRRGQDGKGAWQRAGLAQRTERAQWLVGALGLVLLGCGESEDPTACTLANLLRTSTVCDPAGTEAQSCKFVLAAEGSTIVVEGAACSATTDARHGADCTENSDCAALDVCLHGMCTAICPRFNCYQAQSQCYRPGWLVGSDGEALGYCVESSLCSNGTATCAVGRSCRPLFEGGRPEALVSYRSACQPPLGELAEGESCSFSDECAEGLVCSGMPETVSENPICRRLCRQSDGCTDSVAGSWCSVDTSSNGVRLTFEVDFEVWGVCLEP